jgi:hypothetical protein
VVSLFAFVVTAYGMNPYLVASFNSGLACEAAKSALISAALEQSVAGTSTYAMAPKTLKCIGTPGLVAGGARPPEPSLPPPKRPAPPPTKRPAQK